MKLLSRTIRIWAIRLLVSAVLLACLAYIGDYVLFQYRLRHNSQPFGTVTIQVTYAIAEKAPRGSQKTEYAAGSTQDQTCANALFPQSGYSPCWYLRRKARPQINM